MRGKAATNFHQPNPNCSNTCRALNSSVVRAVPYTPQRARAYTDSSGMRPALFAPGPTALQQGLVYAPSPYGLGPSGMDQTPDDDVMVDAGFSGALLASAAESPNPVGGKVSAAERGKQEVCVGLALHQAGRARRQTNSSRTRASSPDRLLRDAMAPPSMDEQRTSVHDMQAYHSPLATPHYSPIPMSSLLHSLASSSAQEFLSSGLQEPFGPLPGPSTSLLMDLGATLPHASGLQGPPTALLMDLGAALPHASAPDSTPFRGAAANDLQDYDVDCKLLPARLLSFLHDFV